MKLYISDSDILLGQRAASLTAELINKAINDKGEARLLLSTGVSQLTTFQHLVNEDIDWSKVEGFHLDEYIGLNDNHKASFVKYLRERFVSKVNLKAFNYIDGAKEPSKVIEELTNKLSLKPVDVALIGIGVNCHIAFNDPPCDIETHESFHIVSLDNTCKMQQVNEGWFNSVGEVPKFAISMTVNEILKSKVIISAVPYAVKSQAVYNTINKEISPHYPSTFLKTHSDWHLLLDKESSAMLNNK